MTFSAAGSALMNGPRILYMCMPHCQQLLITCSFLMYFHSNSTDLDQADNIRIKKGLVSQSLVSGFIKTPNLQILACIATQDSIHPWITHLVNLALVDLRDHMNSGSTKVQILAGGVVMASDSLEVCLVLVSEACWSQHHVPEN